MTVPVSKFFDTFLSYTGDHRTFVRKVASLLRREGIEPWFDEWEMIPGDLWQNELAAGVSKSSSCVVFIGPNRVGPWSQEEYRLAISRSQKANEGFRVIPVFLPGANRKDLEQEESLAFLLQRNAISFVKDDDPDAFRNLVYGIRGISPKSNPELATFRGQCPYQGLEQFSEATSRFFFGRELLVKKLLDTLSPQVHVRSNRFLLITGDSGSGKSSLASAGVMAAFRDGKVPGSETWPRFTLVPGSNPVANLAATLWNHEGVRNMFGGELTRLKNALLSDSSSLDLVSRSVLNGLPRNQRLVILVDQFEELFTECENETQFHAFVDNLIFAGIDASDGRTMVLLTMRADFFGKCAQYDRLKHAIKDRQELIGPMTRDEVREAIVRPAQLVGCQFQENLIDTLVDHVADKPAYLPLLQYALLELWERRVGDVMHYSAYKEIGGVDSALSHRAEREFDNLGPEEKKACRLLFLRLSQSITEGVTTRRRISRRHVDENETNHSAVTTVLNRFADRDVRLLVLGGTPEDSTIEVAHEALFTKWNRLREWIAQDRDILSVGKRLNEAADTWTAHSFDRDFLIRGKALEEASIFLLNFEDYLNIVCRRFIAASLVEELEHRTAEEVTPSILAMEPFARWLVPELKIRMSALIAQSPATIDDQRRNDTSQTALCRVYIALLQLCRETEYIDKLVLMLQNVHLDEIANLSAVFQSWSDLVKDQLWQLVDNSASLDTRMRVISVLAVIDHDNPGWTRVAEGIASDLVTGNPLHGLIWLRGIEQVGRQANDCLRSALESWIVDESPRETVRTAAIAFVRLSIALHDENERAASLVRAACIATIKAYDVIVEEFTKNATLKSLALERLISILQQEPILGLDLSDRVTLGRTRAGAAITLSRLKGDFDPQIFLADDPELRSQFIARAFDRGVSIDELLKILVDWPQPILRYTILLTLGKYPAHQSGETGWVSEFIHQLYQNENDSGVHSACEWLLRKWKWESSLESIRQIPTKSLDHCCWQSDGIQNLMLTMIKYEPGRFKMGSEKSEAKFSHSALERDESPAHWVRIDRSFAVSDRHITRGQYKQFSDSLLDSPFLPSIVKWSAVSKKFQGDFIAEEPESTVNWYAAILFCRWLTTKFGMMEVDQCYPDFLELDLNADGFPEHVPVELERRGFRLPTEAEWEYACRCGTTSSYSFGNDVDLLREYAWYVANCATKPQIGGLKMPNVRGVFDMHGNLFDWCYDWYAEYKVDESDSGGPVVCQIDDRSHVIRGGSYYNHAFDCRNATRAQIPTPRRYLLIGFRVARTILSE